MDKRRVMVFVDGTNVLRQLSKYLDVDYKAMNPPETTLDLAKHFIHRRIDDHIINYLIIRRYWFASYQGSEDTKVKYMELLRRRDFEPVLYQNKENSPEKGVDIGLAKEVLVNAFNQNFDIGYLIAGDKDYLELVLEVKRYGPNIYGGFFEKGLSSELRLAFDHFMSFDSNEKFHDRINIDKEKVKKEWINIKSRINRS